MVDKVFNNLEDCPEGLLLRGYCEFARSKDTLRYFIQSYVNIYFMDIIDKFHPLEAANDGRSFL